MWQKAKESPVNRSRTSDQSMNALVFLPQLHKVQWLLQSNALPLSYDRGSLFNIVIPKREKIEVCTCEIRVICGKLLPFRIVFCDRKLASTVVHVHISTLIQQHPYTLHHNITIPTFSRQQKKPEHSKQKIFKKNPHKFMEHNYNCPAKRRKIQINHHTNASQARLNSH